ncbi:MAG: 6,7-dimethyl-8-ribityllumazine synthase [Verrucomicrobiae bacterium]|nr:6,7-dimethyl-8-ribityllumazine synthase [Verrucomicrobiae bacterium]
MLRRVVSARKSAQGGRFAIVASEYNGRYVNSMLRAARRVLQEAGAARIRLVRVPGAFEIPVVAAALARQQPRWSAIICLGLILRGETVHAQQIGDTVSRLLGEISVETGVPVIHEVLLLENTAQADKRCLSPEHNRGAEAAHTAVAMARVMQSL